MEFSTEQEFKRQCGYDIDGAWYPRVTKIVEMKSKPALYRFYGTVGYDNAKRISERSAAEGTLVHEAAEQLLIGELPTVDKTIAPAMNALWAFLQKNKIDVLPEHVERRVINTTHRYAGTLDVLATIEGKFGVLDIKTSEAIYRDYNIQTSAYIDALQAEFPGLTHRWILRIDQGQQCKRCGARLRTKGGRNKVKRANGARNGFNGHYGVISFCPEDSHSWEDPKGIIELKELPLDWQADFRAFLGAKQLWEWEHAYWLKKVGYPVLS